MGPRVALQSYPPGRAHEPCAPGRARAGEGHRAVRDRALQRGPVRSTPLPRRSSWGPFGRPATPALNPERPGRCGLPAEERSTGLLKGPARGSTAPRGPGSRLLPPLRACGTVLSRVRLASPASPSSGLAVSRERLCLPPRTSLDARGVGKAMSTGSGASQSPPGCDQCQEGEGVRFYPHNQKCVTEDAGQIDGTTASE